MGIDKPDRPDKGVAANKDGAREIDNLGANLDVSRNFEGAPEKSRLDNNRFFDNSIFNEGPKYFFIFELPRSNVIGSNSQKSTPAKNSIFPLPTGNLSLRIPGPNYGSRPLFVIDLKISIRTKLSLPYGSWDGTNVNLKNKVGGFGFEGILTSENGSQGYKVDALGVKVGQTRTNGRSEVSLGYEFSSGISVSAAAGSDGSVSVEGGMTRQFGKVKVGGTAKVEAVGSLSEGSNYMGRDFLDELCRLNGFESPML